ncbi:MAG: alkaline phosphatase family protein [Chlamydiia bacterium]|nr:alkaline phosphatase family protein [Chlamydiia bacterium]
MKKKLPLFIFVDALGFDLLRRHPEFMQDQAPERKELETIFGYSSACDPSIISGLLPSQHLMWSSFYYSPETCPYRWVRFLRFLPSAVANYHRVRHYISRLIKWVHGFTGYFQIYNVPFRLLPNFDYAEKYSIWGRDGVLKGRTIFSELLERGIPYYCDPENYDDRAKIADLKQAVSEESIDFAYILLGKLDATMHGVGTRHPDVKQLLDWYHAQLSDLIQTAKQHYEDVPVYIFSDHGMHDVKGGFNLQASIDGLGLRFGLDYAVVYDSTMARFWCFNDVARQRIHEHLDGLESVGRIVPDDELEALGVYFADAMYGDTVFLMHSGVVIAPSHMGRKAIPGMHGFHPSDPESKAAILSNKPLPVALRSIEQIYWLMVNEMGLEISAHPGLEPIAQTARGS